MRPTPALRRGPQSSKGLSHGQSVGAHSPPVASHRQYGNIAGGPSWWYPPESPKVNREVRPVLPRGAPAATDRPIGKCGPAESSPAMTRDADCRRRNWSAIDQPTRCGVVTIPKQARHAAQRDGGPTLKQWMPAPWLRPPSLVDRGVLLRSSARYPCSPRYSRSPSSSLPLELSRGVPFYVVDRSSSHRLLSGAALLASPLAVAANPRQRLTVGERYRSLTTATDSDADGGRNR